MKVRLYNLGRIQYRKALEVQLSLKKEVLSKRDVSSTNYGECLITCQHDPPVYTVGNRSEVYSPFEEQRLRALGADYFATKRGGLITFHGPGQLVCYPILDIKVIIISMSYKNEHFEAPAKCEQGFAIINWSSNNCNNNCQYY